VKNEEFTFNATEFLAEVYGLTPEMVGLYVLALCNELRYGYVSDNHEAFKHNDIKNMFVEIPGKNDCYKSRFLDRVMPKKRSYERKLKPANFDQVTMKL